MYQHINKSSHRITIGVLRHNVKDLLGVVDTKLVKKWALEHGMGKLDMRRKYCWQLVLDAVFVWINKGDRSLCGGSMGYEQHFEAIAA
ncbi:hypothetical protein [Iningainema tapete]|uniref:Uncharacterized protein n=1 Tax=Iningainema tapete BLCC-T55 TaxID=2748662 RepID=A0A8J6XSL4_9CYAN|nr:hypothetical protein [Iningainema tapete]MBD2776751.1 hypothetical protein [Iningainema tapete BLCC-T55]